MEFKYVTYEKRIRIFVEGITNREVAYITLSNNELVNSFTGEKQKLSTCYCMNDVYEIIEKQLNDQFRLLSKICNK